MSDNSIARWEYTVLGFDTYRFEDDEKRKTFIEKTNKLGQEGWELITGTVCNGPDYFFFKRKLP